MTGGIVALKRINTEQEENGFPITALREVKILKALNHENVVKLKEIVTSKGESIQVGFIYFSGSISIVVVSFLASHSRPFLFTCVRGELTPPYIEH